MAGYCLLLVLLLAGAPGPGIVAALGLAVALGLVSGSAHAAAVRQLPGTPTHASSDLAAQRKAFTSSSAGKLHFGIELVAWLTPLAIFFLPRPWPWPLLAFPVAYAAARHAVTMVVLLRKPGALRRT